MTREEAIQFLELDKKDRGKCFISDAIDMAIKALEQVPVLDKRISDYQKYINALRKCAKEHDSDTTPTGYIRLSDLCRDTANLLEALEQEFIQKVRD